MGYGAFQRHHGDRRRVARWARGPALPSGGVSDHPESDDRGARARESRRCLGSHRSRPGRPLHPSALRGGQRIHPGRAGRAGDSLRTGRAGDHTDRGKSGKRGTCAPGGRGPTSDDCRGGLQWKRRRPGFGTAGCVIESGRRLLLVPNRSVSGGRSRRGRDQSSARVLRFARLLGLRGPARLDHRRSHHRESPAGDRCVGGPPVLRRGFLDRGESSVLDGRTRTVLPTRLRRPLTELGNWRVR